MKATIGDKELEFPDNLKYSDKHQWFDAASGKVGITAFAVSQLGEIITCDISGAKGKALNAGQLIEDISVEAQKAVADIYSPVSGTVAEINKALEDSPEKIGESPYGDGWLFQFSGASASGLMDAAAYVKFCQSQ
jgi:glycine cleavage system H protein